MKSLLYILILLLLALSLKPCPDKANAVRSERQVMAVVGLHQDHQDNAADPCTPFCACHCCHTHFQPQSADVVEYADLQEVSHEVDLYKSSFVSSLSYSIWQPPKVA
ncbi:DUF6660 family protein [Pontibacter rugosus]|uniref:DUF6660 family protein n=1 Tax=Pontibacter rugosus TaxID=1745966 RepID=A0ABW3SRX9_9BACT